MSYVHIVDIYAVWSTWSAVCAVDSCECAKWEMQTVADESRPRLTLMAAGRKSSLVCRSFHTFIPPHEGRRVNRPCWRWVFDEGGSCPVVRLSASGWNIKNRYLTLPLHKMHAACFSHRKKRPRANQENNVCRKSAVFWIHGLIQDFLRAGLFLVYLHRTG